MRNLLIAGVVGCWCFLTFDLLGRSLTLDECITLWVVEADSFQEFLLRAFYAQGNSPLYSLIVRIWAFFGTDEYWLRLSSVCFSLASVRLVFLIGSEFISRSAAVWGAALFLVSPSNIFLSTTLRPYALGVFFLLFAFYLFLHYLKTAEVRRLVAAAFSYLVSIYAHPAFLIGGLLFLIGFLLRRQELKGQGGLPTRGFLIGITASFVLLSLPAFVQTVVFVEVSTAGIAELSLVGLVRSYLSPSFAAALLALLVLVFSDRGRGEGALKEGITFLLFWQFAAVIPFLLANALTGLQLLQSRYLVWTEPAIFLLAAFLLERIFPRRLFHVALLSLVILTAARVSNSAWVPQEDWRGASEELIRRDLEMPLVVRAMVSERPSSKFFEDGRWKEFLAAPLYVYPVPQEIHTAFWVGDAQWRTEQFAEIFTKQSEVLLLTRGEPVTGANASSLLGKRDLLVETLWRGEGLALMKVSSSNSLRTQGSASRPT